jgi:small subunit ribosomal protein S18
LVDYKDIAQLRRYLSERGRIRGRANTGVCRRHQAQLATAIKRAREMALLPYIGDAGPPTNRPRSHGDR